jgi:uncharacterized protein
MKKLLLVFAIALSSSTLFAQKDYKVVFDMTSNDSINQKLVIRWVDEILAIEPNADIEIVFYAMSVPMVVKGKSMKTDDILRLSAHKNVAFRVCAVALKAHHFDKSDLINGVETVPDGIYEIISKQRQGWGYIKVAH